MKKITVIMTMAAFILGGTLLNSCQKDEFVQKNTTELDDLKKGQPAKTAQSIMIDIAGANDFVIFDDQIWAFDPACAAGYFSASGGFPFLRPAAIGLAALANMCAFWDGGTLTGGSYLGVSVTPNVASVDARTCWNLAGSVVLDAEVPVEINITIAGESYMENKRFTKYSFDLLGTDEFGEPVSRVTDLVVELWLDGELVQTLTPDHDIVQANDDNGFLLDFMYFGNAGVNNGANGFDILDQLHTADGMGPDTMGEILLKDSFANNNNGEDNCIAVVETLSFDLGVGEYTLKVMGKVKGNDGAAASDFMGEYSYRIWLNPCE